MTARDERVEDGLSPRQHAELTAALPCPGEPCRAGTHTGACHGWRVRTAWLLAPLVAHWLADDPAQATLARVEALPPLEYETQRAARRHGCDPPCEDCVATAKVMLLTPEPFRRYEQRVAAALGEAIKDVCWRAVQYGETEDGDTYAYLVTKGAMHRLIGAAQAAGIPAAFRAALVPGHDHEGGK